MPTMQAYLDDFGKVQVGVSRAFYNGVTSGFYITDDKDFYCECVVNGIEEHSKHIRYNLTIPAGFEFGKRYFIHETHGQQVPLEVRYIVRTKRFDEMFTYDGSDLGSHYNKDYTDFAVWAPTAVDVNLKLYNAKNQVYIFAMSRHECGIYRCRLKGNLKHCTYVYIVERDGKCIESIDPYALSSTANARRSAIIDTSEIFDIEDPGVNKPLKTAADAIIYECSVRDMTSSLLTQTHAHRTFAALTESGTHYQGNPTGLEYLCSLGVTHIQFQPVTDFATVDELHSESGYNWGYDPLQLLSLEGSYSSNPNDPYCRMKEFRKLVTVLHSRGLRVNLDVVFNHMYDVALSSFDRLVPYYYFRYNENQYLSNGSWCGNDLDSKQPMMQKYFMDVIAVLMILYGVDGFRFDLMGIIDVETMNKLRKVAKGIKPEAMIYGEGWDMPTALNQNEKSMIYNQRRMPGIGHFNDTFRDVIKGHTSFEARYDRGYLTGNLAMSFDMCSALTGNAMDEPYFKRFDTPIQSINALETHDNATLWDKMHSCCSDEPRDLRKRRQKMMILSTMVAQGIPFLHAGMEFCATKRDNDNSYNAGDDINGMNWERQMMYSDVLTFTRKAIQLRKHWSSFRLTSSEELQKYVHFEIHDDIVFYDITCDDVHNDSGGVRVIFNPSLEDKEYTFEDTWRIVFDENGEEKQEAQQTFKVPYCSALVLSKLPVNTKGAE